MIVFAHDSIIITMVVPLMVPLVGRVPKKLGELASKHCTNASSSSDVLRLNKRLVHGKAMHGITGSTSPMKRACQ